MDYETDRVQSVWSFDVLLCDCCLWNVRRIAMRKKTKHIQLNIHMCSNIFPHHRLICTAANTFTTTIDKSYLEGWDQS